MDNESFRLKSAINDVTNDILSAYDAIGKTDIEIRDIVSAAIEAEGGENGMGSTMLWVNYVKKAVLKRALEALHIEYKS